MGRVAPRPPDRGQDLGRPLLVIKGPSPDTRRPDRETKRHLYQALGIPEYWIVDPDTRTVEIWTPADRTPRLERQRLRWSPEGAPAPPGPVLAHGPLTVGSTWSYRLCATDRAGNTSPGLAAKVIVR